jgi:hypothetical protein
MKDGIKIKGELKEEDKTYQIFYLKNKIKWKEKFIEEDSQFKYRGAIYQNKPKGRGILTRNKEIFWEGIWKYGKEFEGKGTCLWIDDKDENWIYKGKIIFYFLFCFINHYIFFFVLL